MDFKRTRHYEFFIQNSKEAKMVEKYKIIEKRLSGFLALKILNSLLWNIRKSIWTQNQEILEDL